MTTIYVVTGLMRSGTTMLMSALNAGGLEAVYDKETDERINKNATEGHGDDFLGGSYYECGFKTVEDIKELDGKLVKMFYGGITRTLIHHKDVQYKVVETNRAMYDVIKSMTRWIRIDPAMYTAERLKEIHDLRDVRSKTIAMLPNFDRIILNYEDIVQDPLREMTKLAKLGWPIDPKKAAQDIISGRSRRLKANDIPATSASNMENPGSQ